MTKQKIAIDDVAKLKKLGALTLSPSGKKAAFTVTEGCVKENKYLNDIWVYDEAHEPALYRLTAGDDGTAPMFLDDNTILFASDRKKNHKSDAAVTYTTYNTISLNGGEAEEAFYLPFAVSFLKHLDGDLWLAGGRRNVTQPDISGLEGKEKEEAMKLLEEEKDYSVFDELPFWFNGKGVINKVRTGLFLCDVKENTQDLLTDLYMDVEGLALNADKSKCVYWGRQFTTLNTMKSLMYIRDLKEGTVTQVALEDKYSVTKALFLGDQVMFLGTMGEKYGTSQNDDVVLVQMDGSIRTLCSPDISFGAVGSDVAGGGMNWSPDDAFYFLHTDNYRSKYKKMTADGEITLLADDINIISAAVGREDDIYFIGMETDMPQEFYRKKNGAVEKLSAFNQEFVDTHEIAHSEHFSFLDRDGVEIDGWVLYPADFDPEKKYPGILTVHGGPRAAYGEGFFHEFQFWAACGYIVFFCNPRGSSGKGDKFADILEDKFGVDDYNDLMDFTDEVLKRVPQIDTARVAMTGGSYGGFMANWIIGHTDRFACVASCRSISNYLSKCLTTDIGYYHNLSQIGGDPWGAPEKMWAHSPLAYADKAKTPTLFIQSDEDYRCWMGDAIQMMQALLMHGVPTRMCLFHGENHELSRSGKPKHRIRRLKEMTDWFDKYLGMER